MDAMRISVSNWSTSDEDVDLSADSIVRDARQAIGIRESGVGIRHEPIVNS